MVFGRHSFPTCQWSRGMANGGNRSTIFCQPLLLLIHIRTINIDHLLSFLLGLTNPIKSILYIYMCVYIIPSRNKWHVKDYKKCQLQTFSTNLKTNCDFFQETGTLIPRHHLRAGTVWDSKDSLSEAPGMSASSSSSSTMGSLLVLALASISVV